MTIDAAEPGEQQPLNGRADRLRADRDHAHEQLLRLEQEYAAMLADPGVLQEDRDNSRTLLEAARHTFETAQAALDHVETKTYGQCVSCGGPIGAERLEALPGATMCVTCQARS
jgi:RNA polymerase-binding transcription factor DksA